MSREGIRRWIAAVRHAMDSGRVGRQSSPSQNHSRISRSPMAPLIGRLRAQRTVPSNFGTSGPFLCRSTQHAARTLV